MKKLFLSILMLTSLKVFCQNTTTTKDIIGKELAYNFGGFIIDITFTSDTTLYWKERKSGQEANEKTKTQQINDHTILTGWYESDKTFVSLYSDFLKGETYGYQFRVNGKTIPLKGTIVLKK
jgi:hypothetical protein